MRARAVAALHEVLTFQDVRARVADATPSVVASLVGLLRQEGASGSKGRASPNQREGEASSARQGGSRCQPQLRSKKGEHARLRDGQGSLVKIAEKGKRARKELCPRTCEAPLHAAACLRILALSDGLPQMMTSASAIPALVDGVKKGSSLMKSVCGGCLTSLARCEDESCSEMIDFGVLPLLLDLIRDENRMLEQMAWSLLAAIMRVREARHAFVGAGGLNDVGEMLARKRRRRGSNRFLLAGQESAMRVLLSLCGEEEDEEDDDGAINRRGGESSLATSPTIPSVLLLGEDKARGAENEVGHYRLHGESSRGEGRLKAEILRTFMSFTGSGASRREDTLVEFLRRRRHKPQRVAGSSYSREGGPLLPWMHTIFKKSVKFQGILSSLLWTLWSLLSCLRF
ncbi:unnamed protein product [Scytosiphon promiscuus]